MKIERLFYILNFCDRMNTDYDLTRVIAGTCLALSSCGSMVAACTLDKDLTVWDVSSRELLHHWEAPRKVSALTFSKNGRHLIVAGNTKTCQSIKKIIKCVCCVVFQIKLGTVTPTLCLPLAQKAC